MHLVFFMLFCLDLSNTFMLNKILVYHTEIVITDWFYHSAVQTTSIIAIILSYPEPVVIQWQSSGNQCALSLDPSVHWNATGERIVSSQCVSSGLPLVFQWISQWCSTVFQLCKLKLPLGHHWVLASASVVPMASQCTCASSGLPVCSNYAN